MRSYHPKLNIVGAIIDWDLARRSSPQEEYLLDVPTKSCSLTSVRAFALARTNHHNHHKSS